MTNKEKAVREAAAALQTAILDARAAGLSVTWPRRFEDLPFIAISETGKGTATVSVAVPAGAGPDAVAKASLAAQTAVDKAPDPPAKK
jgi:hypothetical protein